jgi:hypothetical protein
MITSGNIVEWLQQPVSDLLRRAKSLLIPEQSSLIFFWSVIDAGLYETGQMAHALTPEPK